MLFYTNAETTKKDIIVSYIQNGKRGIRNVDFKPKLYLPNQQGTFRSIYNDPLSEYDFTSVSDFKRFKREEPQKNTTIYGDIAPHYQFIRTHFKDTKEFDINLCNKVYFDIEVSSIHKDDRYILFPEAHLAPIPIVSVALYSSLHKTMTLMGFGDYDKTKSIYPNMNTIYIKCPDEKYMLRELASYLTNVKTRPDMLYGWHSSTFDIPYIHNRMLKLGGSEFVNKLSPVNNVYSTEAMRRIFGQSEPYLKYTISGIPHLDMMDVYRKFSGHNCSFSMALNNIAKRDLKQEKMDYGSSRSIMDMYWEDYQRYLQYNIKDTYLLKLIDDYNLLSEKLLASAIENKCNLVDTLGTTKQWETILYNAFSDRGLIIPNRVEHEKPEYAGGFVRASITGVKMWNLTLDFTSLYPNIMIGMNISPETLKKIASHNCVVSPNGVFFDTKEQGVLARCVEDMFNKRLEYKRLMKEYKDNPDKVKEYDVKQYLEKININSVYGATANRYFLYFKAEMAEAITMVGQYAIKRVADCLNGVMNVLCDTEGLIFFDYELDNFTDVEQFEDFIVMGDTDSCAISFELYVNKFLKGKTDQEILDCILDLYKTDITPALEKCLNEIQAKYNFYKKTLKLSLETVTKKSIFLQKKRYLGHVVYDEGKINFDYDDPSFKIKGVEGIKSSTPEYFQEKFMKFYHLCLLSNTNDEIRDFLVEVEEDYKKQYIVESGKPIKIKNLDKYAADKGIYKLRTPENTKGSLIYNHYIKKFKLEHKYNLLRDGDYGKLLKLKSNNGFTNVNLKGYLVSETVICVPDDEILPPEFDLDNSVDYEEQFFKFFKKPCLGIMDIMGINHRKMKVIKG